MPRTCTVCASPKRAAIDKALLNNEPYRHIASQHGVSTAALQRHRSHIPQALAKAQEAEEIAQADDLLGQVRELKERMETQYRFTQHILAKAAQADELRTMLLAVREASNVNREMRGCLELLAKLLGQLDDRPQINILLAPEWLILRSVLMDVLSAYPEARVAVAGNLARLEAGQ